MRGQTNCGLTEVLREEESTKSDLKLKLVDFGFKLNINFSIFY